ncbi:hypothetical protein BH11ARM1_BH11ARM1_03440 [soil metagenome]
MGRISEWIAGRTARNRPIFTGVRRHLTSMEVRGVQIARELDGICTRCRYLTEATVASAPALIWVIEPELDLVKKFDPLTVQFFDPINPRVDPSGEFSGMNQSFRYLLLNTESSINWLGPEPETGWMSFVIPHHHCNKTGYRLPESRLEKPKVVGYLGQPEHLHDGDEIKAAVEKMGLEFRSFDTWDLDAYQNIDIGIAWTRRDELRDQTRSNIKLANFAAHGIPSVVCDYESYRAVDKELGGAALVRADLTDFIQGIHELATSPEKRRAIHAKADQADQTYSLTAIAQQYQSAIARAKEDAQR